MNSQERVLSALDRQAPDRVPVDLCGQRWAGMAAVAYARLRRHLDLELRAVRIGDPFRLSAVLDQDLLDRFGLDTVDLGQYLAPAEEDCAYWVLPDGTPCLLSKGTKPERDGRTWKLKSRRTDCTIAELPAGAAAFQQTASPLADQDEVGDLRAALADAPETWDGLLWGATLGMAQLGQRVRKLRIHSDRAMVCAFGGVGTCVFLAYCVAFTLGPHRVSRRVSSIEFGNFHFLPAIHPPEQTDATASD